MLMHRMVTFSQSSLCQLVVKKWILFPCFSPIALHVILSHICFLVERTDWFCSTLIGNDFLGVHLVISATIVPSLHFLLFYPCLWKFFRFSPKTFCHDFLLWDWITADIFMRAWKCQIFQLLNCSIIAKIFTDVQSTTDDKLSNYNGTEYF